MNSQTESYIVLKPLADRFNEIAKEFTDEDIKSLIKSSIREQIKTVDFASEVQDIISNYLDNHESDIVDMYKKELENKFR